RLTTEVKANGERIEYNYDARGRLSTVTTSAAPHKGHWKSHKGRKRRSVVTWSRHYGPDGLLSTVVRSSNERHSKDDRWELTWDRSLAVPQPLGWTKNGKADTELVRGVGLAFSIENDKVSRIRFNPLGDVVDSRVSVAGSFDPFGDSGKSDRFGLGYRGELHIGPTINLKARDLNPTLGRFLTPDPLTMPDGSAATSRYAYAANDPINLTDPFGLTPTDDNLNGDGVSEGDGGSWRDFTWGGLADALRRAPGEIVDAVLEDPIGWAALTVVTVAATAAVVVTSPAWVTAAGIGALVAIGVTVGVGLVTGRFDPRSATINGLVGAATGGFSVASGGFSLGRAMLIEGIGSGVGDVVSQVVIDGTGLDELDRTSVALNTGIGAASAGLFTGGFRFFTRNTPSATPSGTGNTEVFYRGMSNAEYGSLLRSGGLSPRGESFVSQDLGYVEQLAARNPGLYQRLVQFEMQSGTRSALLAAGARDRVLARTLRNQGLGTLPIIQKGDVSVVHVKGELDAVNFGLKSGSAEIFNCRIVSFCTLAGGQ
ncbi:MAG: RHS repeat-associated core domain-containing protein, partial [Acidimicrobiales bacterium]